MRDAENGIGEDEYYVIRGNLKTQNVNGFMKRSYKEGWKEWEAFIKYGLLPIQCR